MENPHSLQVLVAVLAAVLLLTWLARRLGMAAPPVLLLGGVPLGFLPWVHGVMVSPAVILLLFLPALLYWESLTTSLREIRANLRTVLLMSTGLVLATAGAVAVVGHALGMSWPVAWVLGAVVAPTDATAVTAVAGRMSRRILTTLRTESLINDGTALVVFAIAVATATGQQTFHWGSGLGRFGISYLGGITAGLVVAWLAAWARKFGGETLVENGINTLAPFAAFLLAEQIHASGVLAVVVCGLTFSHIGPRLASGRTRLQARAFWQLTAFLLNGTLFVLLGVQLPGALHRLTSHSLGQAGSDSLLVSAALIGTRLIWMNTVPYLIRLLDRRPRQRLRRIGARHRFLLGWAGFRGGASLAAALAVPVTLADGSPFPERDLIVVIAFGAILVTLLVQGLTLPAVLRWSRLTDDGAEAREQLLAERAATEAGLAALTVTARHLKTPPSVTELVRADHEDNLHSLTDAAAAHHDAAVAGLNAHTHHHHRLRAALLPHKRAALIRLRDIRLIDDIVLRRVQVKLDGEELALTPPPATEVE
jgi:monovalent cation/hydrogen antiporter